MAFQHAFLFLMAFVAVTGASFPQWLSRREKIRGDIEIGCDPATCLEPLGTLADPDFGFKIEAVDCKEDMEASCAILRRVPKCLKKTFKQRRCSAEDKPMTRVLIRSIRRQHKFFCIKNGIKVLLKEKICWENRILRSKFQDCSNTVRDQYKDSKGHKHECQLIHGYRSCSVNVTRTLCNKRAARFIDQIIFNTMQPLAAHILGCRLDRPK